MEQHAPDTPMFSIIMPLYNHAEYVADAVRSVQAQSCEDWELVVVDDGSTDGSTEIIDDLAVGDKRITVTHQPNAGPAAARNAGLKRSRGRYLAYIDSDDVYLPDALARFAAHFAAHPQAKFIYGYRHRLNGDGSVTKLSGEHQDRPTGTAELFKRMYLSHLCVCYRRELIDRAGHYDEGLRMCEDYELYLRISLHCPFEPIGQPTGLRRRHGKNLSRQTGYSRMLEAEVLRRFVEQQGGAAVLERAQIHWRLGRLYYAAGRQYFKAGCFRQAIAAIRLANNYRRTVKAAAIRLLSLCLLPLGRDDGREMPRL